MSQKPNLAFIVISIFSLVLSACNVSIVINPTSVPVAPTITVPENTTVPKSTAVPAVMPMATETPTITYEEVHEVYAGLTGNADIDLLVLHPTSGESIGVSGSVASSRIEEAVWASPTGESIVISPNISGLPGSAVVDDHIILYSNYTDSTVDITIVRPDGRREFIRAKYTADVSKRMANYFLPRDTAISFSTGGLLANQNLNYWAILDDALFMTEIVTCVGAGSLVSLNIPALAALAVACHSPLLELKIREGKVENMDVGDLEAIQDGLDIYGCFAGNPIDCVNKFVRDMANATEEANKRLEQIPAVPTKVKKYP